MPPTPGIFPVPYGTNQTHNPPGAVISSSVGAPTSSSVVAGPGGSQVVIGPGVPGTGAPPPPPGFGPPQHYPPSGKLTRVPGVSGVLNGGPTDGGEMYGPGIGHGLQAHGHGHGGHSLQHGHVHHFSLGGSSSRHATSGAMEESLGRKEKRKKDALKHKEVGDRRDDSSRHITDRLSALHNTAHLLCTRPDLSLHFQLRLYPLSLERSALLAQFEAEERYAVELAQVAYEEERERVEEEWRRGRERVRERLMEGIEERRRRAREEKEGEGAIGDASLDSHSRPPITRKLRNKLGSGTSPPPTPQIAVLNGLPIPHPLSAFSSTAVAAAAGSMNGALISTGNLPITTGPFLNPHSLNVDDLPSPFPLPLTASGIAHSASGALGAIGAITSSGAAGAGAGGGGAASVAGGVITALNGGRRRVKGGGGHQGQALGGLGKSLAVFNVQKESIELENDLNEIKRGNKRRRAAAASNVKC